MQISQQTQGVADTYTVRVAEDFKLSTQLSTQAAVIDKQSM